MGYEDAPSKGTVTKGIAELSNLADSLIEFIDNPAVKTEELTSINDKVMGFFKLINEANSVELDMENTLRLYNTINSFHKAVSEKYQKLGGKTLMANVGATAVREKGGKETLAHITQLERKAESTWKDIVPSERKAEAFREQVIFRVQNHEIRLYNFGTLLTKKQIGSVKKAMSEMASHFPETIANLKTITIDNVQHDSLEGDEEVYPANGYSPTKDSIELYPRALQAIPHRVVDVPSNLEGTVVHEMAHSLINYGNFASEWTDKLRWDYCKAHPDEWKSQLSPNGKKEIFVNKQTGEMAPEGTFPLHPEQCVSDYAKISINEDFCDSVVAYVYNPILLKRVSSIKFEILQKHDAKLPHPTITTV